MANQMRGRSFRPSPAKGGTRVLKQTSMQMTAKNFRAGNPRPVVDMIRGIEIAEAGLEESVRERKDRLVG